jgi:hypothetical protein
MNVKLGGSRRITLERLLEHFVIANRCLFPELALCVIKQKGVAKVESGHPAL